MARRLPLIALMACASGAAYAEPSPPQEGAPRSVIGWLSQSIAEQPSQSARVPSTGAPLSAVETKTIPAAPLAGVGLMSAQDAGLSARAWQASNPARLIQLLDALRPAGPAPLASLRKRMLLAEFMPPSSANTDLFIARIDTLLRLAHVSEAQALLERAGPTAPEIFRRWFDVSLLTGHDAHACNALRQNPAVKATLPAKIFCLSRTDDWAAAALSLETGQAIGEIDTEMADLLARFLDPEFFEEEELPFASAPVTTPLQYRLMAGIGEAPDTRTLAVPFAVADLRETMGWKKRLDAAERLSRVHALPATQMLALYTERMPAASGGVWERAEAVQRLDVAMISGDPTAISGALVTAWRQLGVAGLRGFLVEVYGARLQDPVFAALPLSPEAEDIAWRLRLMSSGYLEAAKALPQNAPPALRSAAQLALGRDDQSQTTPFYAAMAEGFRQSAPPVSYGGLLARGAVAEAILEALLVLQNGPQGDPNDLGQALALLRAAGLEDTARRTAIAFMLEG